MTNQYEDLSDTAQADLTDGGFIRLTDQFGRWMPEVHNANEPLPGSIVLTEGEWGTAWQRLFSDGLWHACRGGRGKTWKQMSTMKNMLLVHDAGERVL